MTIITQPANKPVHINADWDGTDYSNTSGLSEGILLEGARTNRVRWSIDLTNGVWALDGGCTIAEAPTPSPGETPAYLVDISSADARVNQPLSSVPAGDYLYSVWMRSVSGAGTFPVNVYGTTTASGGHNRSTLDLTEEWQLFAVPVTLVGTGIIYLYLSDSRSQSSTLTEAYAWNPQFQLGAFPSSVIPTEAAAVTRAATQMTATIGELGMTGTLVNNISGQIKVRPQFNPADDRGAVTDIFRLYSDASNHIALTYTQATDVISLTKTVAGTGYTAEYTAGDLAYSTGDELTIDWACADTGMSLQVVGFAPKTNANTAALATALASCTLGASFQTVASMDIYPRAVP